MSNLETVAQRVLTPLILDEPGTITLEDQAAIATWVQKTALTAMLLSSKEQRENGYGLSPSEYRALYERRELMQPLEFSQFWVGRFKGINGFSAVRVTPLTVRIPGFPEPALPQGYAMTVVVGALLLHGVRFTTPGLQADTTTDLGMPQLWPSDTSVTWPAGRTCTEKSLLALADGVRCVHWTVRCDCNLGPTQLTSRGVPSKMVQSKSPRYAASTTSITPLRSCEKRTRDGSTHSWLRASAAPI